MRATTSLEESGVTAALSTEAVDGYIRGGSVEVS